MPNSTDNTRDDIRDAFEKTFLKSSLDEQLSYCDSDELVPTFRKYLPKNQPILEAGSGSGRWVAWFIKNGWKSTGLDLSEVLCDRARRSIPGSRFESGDMRAMPFKDQEFGAIVALGSVEHLKEGPLPTLKEFYRVLRPGGIAIITVPYRGSIQKISKPLCQASLALMASPLIRKLFGKKAFHKISLKMARAEAVEEWQPRFCCNNEGWYFSEYNFTKEQMVSFINSSGLSIIEEFSKEGDKGIIFNFGDLAGYFNDNELRPYLNGFGRLIKMLIAGQHMSHMLCYVVTRKR